MSTFVNDLRLEEIGTGEASGTWGTKTNVNLELIAEAMGHGTEAIDNASTHTITMQDAVSDEFRCNFLRLTGGGQACTVTLAPNTLSHTWIMRNETNSTLTFTQGSGASVTITAGQTKVISTDGAGSGAVVYEMDDLELANNLNVGGNVDVDGTLETDALSINSTTVTSTAAELNILDGVTSTAAELNILDGVTSTTAELNILDGATVVVGEINALDLGSTAVGTAIASKAVILDANKDYTGIRNLTISGELDAGSLDISGDVDVDGTLETDALSINSTTVTSTAAELNILDGVTSTAAELNILDGVTSTAAELNILDGVTSTTAELNILDGATVVVGEINALDLGSTAVGTAIASKAVILDANKDYTGIRNLTISGELDAGSLDISGDVDVDGTLETDALSINSTTVTSTAAELNILDGVTSTAAELNILDGVTSTAAELNILDGVTSTTAELNILDGATVVVGEINALDLGSTAVGTAIASKAVILDANKDYTGIRNLTISGELDAGSLDISGDVDVDGTLETDALSINSTTVTSTAAELNILDGVTSTAAELNILDGVTSTAAELNILDGVTSTTAELNILDGATVVVGEINALDLGSTAVGTAIASKAVILDANKDYTGIRNLTISGELDAGSLDISGDVDVDGTLETDALSINSTTVTSTAAELNILDGVTSTTAELNILDGATVVVGEINALDLGSTAVGTAIASKAVILDANKDYTGIRNLTISGELDAASLDISGDVDVDGTLETDNLTIGGAQGTDGQVLTSTGSGVGWEDASGGGSGQEITVITGNTTLANSDSGKLIQTETSGITITIPALSGLDADWFVDIETINTNTFNHGKVTIDITTNNTGASIATGGNGTLYGAQKIRLQRSPAGGDAQGQLSAFVQTMLTGAIIVREDRLAGSLQGGDVGVGSIMLGNANNASGNDCIGMGQLVTSNATGSIAIGSYSGGSVTSSATSSGATAIGGAGASGSNGLAMHTSNSSTSYGATGTRSLAIGNLSKASNTDAKCISNTSTASGTNSLVIGGSSGTASGNSSTVLGGNSNVADLDYAIAKGYYGNANGVRGKEVFGCGDGRQRAQYCLSIDTTDATPTVMGVDYDVSSLSAANQLVIPNNTVMAFSGLVTCRQQAADGTDSAAFEIKGLLRREGAANTTTLVNSTLTTISNAQSFGVALSANTTLGSLSITVTGAASHDLRWVAQLDTAESTYA